MDQQHTAILDINTPGRYPRHCLSLGMGVESVAILLRWIYEPDSRDFDLDDLVVISAMTGDEFLSTARDMVECVLPAMRRATVRFVQAGRNRLNTTKAGDGISVFSDTTAPTELYISGDFALSSEMLAAGTLPQLGGHRKCSQRAKGAVLDAIIPGLTGGLPFGHYMGFHTGEMTRIRRDQTYNTPQRTGLYPLLDWGWSRQDASDWLAERTGRVFTKSCCTYCPFAVATSAGRGYTLDRYRDEPDSGAKAVFVEHVALCLNERQGLVGDRRLIDLVTDAGLHEVLARFHARVAASDHAIYHVRRLARPRCGTSPMIARSVRGLRSGSRCKMLDALQSLPGRPVTGQDGITRMVVRERDDSQAWAEEFYVVAPNVVLDKERPQFGTWWTQNTDPMALFAI